MKVYIVQQKSRDIFGEYHGIKYIIGVFDTEEKAKEYIKEDPGGVCIQKDYSIQDEEVK